MVKRTANHTVEHRKFLSEKMAAWYKDSDYMVAHKARVSAQWNDPQFIAKMRRTCPHCGKNTSVGSYSRHHGDNCKHKELTDE